jgi:hypothetical protein
MDTEAAAMMWTAQVTAVVGLALGVARLAHGLGRSAGGRARLRRLVLHRAVPWAAAGLSAAGAAVIVLLPWSAELPRRYADYLPDDAGGSGARSGAGSGTHPLAQAVLATMLIGGSVLLITVWWWLRYAGPPGRYRSLLRRSVPGVGGLLLLTGLACGWIADRTAPASFGWYMYSPLNDATFSPQIVNGEARAMQGVAATLTVLGLGALTAMAAFRAARRETTGPGRP